MTFLVHGLGCSCLFMLDVLRPRVLRRPILLYCACLALQTRLALWCIRLTLLTLVCEVIRYHLVQVQKNVKKITVQRLLHTCVVNLLSDSNQFLFSLFFFYGALLFFFVVLFLYRLKKEHDQLRLTAMSISYLSSH